MATKNNRDVKLSLSVETLGAEGVKSLRDTIASLAKEGGDAAPEFQRLADEIDRLGDQAKTLQSFEQIAQTVRELGTAQEQAVAKSAELKAALDTAAASTQKAATAQAELKAEFAAAQRELETTKGQLTILRNSYDDNGKRVANYKAELERLTRAKVEQSSVVSNYRAKLAEANKAVADAESAETKAQKAYNFSEKALDGLTKKLQERRGEMANQSKAIEDMGLSTDDLAQAQGVLLKSLNDTGAAANKLKSELDAARAAEKALADENARAVAANAEKIKGINDEIKFRQQLAAQREAAAKQAAAAEQTVAAEAAAQLKKRQADEQAAFNDKISRINMELKYRQQLAAQRAAVENEANRKSVEAEKQAAKEREAAAKAASDAIANAFKTTGAKSASDLRQQIEAVKGAMNLLGTQAGLTGSELKAAMTAGSVRVKELERDLREATGTLTLADKAAKLLANSMGQIAAGNLIADGIGSLVNQVKDMARQFITANLEMERLTRTMTVITGSAEGAAQKIKFLRDTANLAGVAVGEITDSFIRFNASAQTAGMSSESVDAVFRAVTVSGSKMGMTADRVALALDALGQIASKGTVSMEELRQQLGDSLPGALSISAKGLGVTTQELVRMVETGQVMASQFFPAFKKGLVDAFGDTEQRVEGLYQAWNRLRNAFRELYQEASGSTAFQAMASSLDFLAANLRTVVDVVYGLGKAFVSLKLLEFAANTLAAGRAAVTAAANIGAKTAAVVADSAATAANTAATVANTVAKTANNATTAATVTGLGLLTTAKAAATTATGLFTSALVSLRTASASLFAAIGGLPGLFVAVAVNAKELGTAIGEQAARWMGWGKVMDEAAAKLAAQDAAEKKSAEERRQRTAQLEIDLQKEISILAQKVKSSEQVVAATEKHTKAIQAQGDYTVRLASLSGDRIQQLQAEYEAAVNNARAAEEELNAKQNLISEMELELAKRMQVINSGREVTQKYKEETQAVSDLLQKKREEAAQSKVAVENSALEVAQRRIATETTKDNALRVNEYAEEVRKAKDRVAELTRLSKEGYNVDLQLKQAKIDLAAATRLYSDSVNDATRKIQLNSDSRQAEINLVKAGLEARKAEYDSLAKSAEAQGKDKEATDFKVKSKQAEIEIIKQTVAAINTEVEANIRILETKRASIQGTDDESNARRRELDIQIQQEKARGIEANSRLANIRNLQDEIKGLKDIADSRDSETASIEKNNAARERSIAAREKEMELKEREDALERKRLNVDKEKFTLDANGNRMQQSVVTPQFAFNEAKSQGVSDAEALRISDYYRNMAANDSRMADTAAFYQMVNEAKIREARSKTGVGAAGNPAQQATVTGSTSTAKTYNVNVMGRTIKTTSDADAKALIDVLKQASLTS